MGGVAAPPGLRLVERHAQANRHHRVLERHALERVDVHVAGGHARHPEPLGQLAEQAVAAAVVAGEGPLELYAQALRPEGPQQPARDRGRAGMVARLHPAGHRAVTGAAREAHEPLGVVLDLLERHGRLVVERVLGGPPSGAHAGRRLGPALARPAPGAPVGRGDQPAEVRIPLARLAQEREVGAVVERELRSGDRAHPEGAQRARHLHCAVKAVVVGQREGAVALFGGDPRKLSRMRSPVEEGVRRVAVELHIGHEHMFASGSRPERVAHRPGSGSCLPRYHRSCSQAHSSGNRRRRHPLDERSRAPSFVKR